MDGFTLIISIVALAISGITYWQSHQRPFKLKLVLPGFFGYGDDYLRKDLCDRVILFLSFLNQGAKSGSIDLIALKLETDDHYIYLIGQFVIPVWDATSPELPSMHPFCGFVLRGGEQASRTVAFSMYDPTSRKLEAKCYKATVLVRTNGEAFFHAQGKISMTITKEELEAMAKQRSADIISLQQNPTDSTTSAMEQLLIQGGA